MDVERGLISSVVEQGDLGFALEQNIKGMFFNDQMHHDVWDMIIDHWTQYGTVPDETAVLRAYPTYKFFSPPEPMRYYIDQVKDAYKFRLVVDATQAVINEFDSGGTNPGDRLSRALHQAIQQVHTDVPTGQAVDWWAAMPDHLKLIDERIANPGYLRGISTGFDTIDRVTGGFQPGQLITLVSTPKAGKSSFLVNCGLVASEMGFKVMFFTFEMSIEEQNDRLTSLISKVSLLDILNGTVSLPDRRKIESAMLLRQNLSGFEIISDPSSITTVSAVKARVQQTRPDLVIVDGTYLLDDELGEPKMSSRAITNITQGLKKMAQSERVPVLCSTQALLSRSKQGVEMNSVGYSSSFVMDSDVVFGPDRLTDTLSRFKVIAIRSGPKIDTYVQVDWSTGTIEEIDSAVAEIMLQTQQPISMGAGPSQAQVSP